MFKIYTMAKAVKKAAKKAAPKKATKKATASTEKKTAKKSSRKPNAAFMAPLTLSADLAAIVGNKPLPRSEIVKKMWDYIRKNGLQDSTNKRMINTDDKLKKIFDGQNQISMFEIAKGINKNVK